MAALVSGGAKRSARQRSEAALAWLLLAPSAIVLGLFGFYPLLFALNLSLRDWRITAGPFVGLQNYAVALFESAEFWRSLGVTLWYVAGTVPVTIALAYLIADMLHRRLAGVAIYRSLFFMPYVVSPVAAAAVWTWIFHKDFGLANGLLAWLGQTGLGWLDEPRGVFQVAGARLGLTIPSWAAGPSLALVCLIVVAIWHNLGFAVVILLAGMAAIPGETLEAAQLDGARGWTMIRRIKVPLLSPTLFFLLVVFVIRAFQTFTQIYVLSPDNRGGPLATTRNVTMYIFSQYWDAQRIGYASAVAMILFAIILALTLVQFRLLGRRVHYG